MLDSEEEEITPVIKQPEIILEEEEEDTWTGGVISDEIEPVLVADELDSDA